MMRFIFFILVVFFSSPSYSAVAVTTPLMERVEIQNGQVIKKNIVVKNLSSKPATVKIYLEENNVNGTKKSHPRSNLRWIKLGATNVKLGGGESKVVSYQVRAPGGKGSYWSNIMVEPIQPVLNKNAIPSVENGFGVSIRSVTRYAVSVVTTIGSDQARYAFSAPKMEKSQAGKKFLSVTVRNTSVRHGYFKVRLDVFSSNGKKLASLKGEGDGGLYPSASKRVKLPLGQLAVGKYKALLTAEDIGGGQTFGVDMNLDILP